MWSYIYRHRVRYRECDPMGVVYHTHYLDYFEYARTEALRSLGITYKQLEDSGIIMPVVEAQVRYHQPAYYDDMLAVHTIFKTLPHVRVPIAYEVYREETGAKVASGTVVLCFVDRRRGRPVRAPEEVVTRFRGVLA